MDVHRAAAPVLVGFDGSPSAMHAVRWAAGEAERRRVPLRLVCAFGEATTWRPGDAGAGGEYRDVLLTSGNDGLARAAAAAADEAPGIRVERQAMPGEPIPRLTAESRTAQLAVVGTRGLGGVTGLLAGSVSVALAAHAACPVVVVRGPTADAAPPAEGAVVVGVDGSPASEAAVAFAYEAAAVRRAPLLAVHAWRDTLIDPAWAPIFDWDAVEQEEEALLAERLAGWGQKYPDVEVIRLVARDRPARVLVEHSATAQLLVVGSHGRGGLTGLVLGSVGHAVLHHAQCPVAVVRPEPGRVRP
ncbi:MAG TPA: universal stress protein [Pseudonocardia sp.]|nr:universal stress protein [Pseudonocardia sp.]